MVVAPMLLVGMVLGMLANEAVHWTVKHTRLPAAAELLRLQTVHQLKGAQRAIQTQAPLAARRARRVHKVIRSQILPWHLRRARDIARRSRSRIEQEESSWRELEQAEAPISAAILTRHYECFRSFVALFFASLCVFARQSARDRSRRRQLAMELMQRVPSRSEIMSRVPSIRHMPSRQATLRVLEKAPSFQEVREKLSVMLQNQVQMLRQQTWVNESDSPSKRRASAPQLPSAAAKGKGKGKSAHNAGRRNTVATNPTCFGELPFGQRMHWVGAEYGQSVEGTVFGELPARRESGIDSNLMQKMFSSRSPSSKQDAKGKTGILKAPIGIVLLAQNRAQNLAIAIRSLSCPTAELCKAIAELDFCNPCVLAEDLETLSSSLLTPDEVTKLSAHKDCPEKLRDVERSILPLCQLSPVSLRAMRVVVSHLTVSSLLEQRCQVVHKAASQIRDSEEFRDLLAVILQIGNYINHGHAEVVEGTARGFSIESLHVLSSFKRGGVSALHFLCLTMFQTGKQYFTELMAGLSHVKEASRECTGNLKADVQKFHADAEFLERLRKDMPEGSLEIHRVDEVLQSVLGRDAKLRTEHEQALTLSTEVQTFFSTPDKAVAKQLPFEEFCGHIAAFLQEFHGVWRELEAGKGIAKRVAQVCHEPKKEPQEIQRMLVRKLTPGAPDADALLGMSGINDIKDVSPPRGSSQNMQANGKGLAGRARPTVKSGTQVDGPRARPVKWHAVKRRSKKLNDVATFERQHSEPVGEFWDGLQRQISMPDIRMRSPRKFHTLPTAAAVNPRLFGDVPRSPANREEDSPTYDRDPFKSGSLKARLLQVSDSEDSDSSSGKHDSSSGSSDLEPGPRKARLSDKKAKKLRSVASSGRILTSAF